MSQNKCSKCGKIKLLSRFKKRSDTISGYRSVCRDCDNVTQKVRRHRDCVRIRRRERVAYYKDILGGQCIKCGYSKAQCSIEFHHVNPNKKEAGIAGLISGGCNHQRIMEEVDKCILLCANCHQELETGCWTAEFVKKEIGWLIKARSIIENETEYWQDVSGFFVD